MKKQLIRLFFLSIAYCLLLSSCKKDSFITSGEAKLTTNLYNDSLRFDTVFTSVGSVTQTFRINNPNNQKLLLSKIKLMGGAASAYKININGVPGPELSDIEMAANDSIYVFVTVKVDPSNENLPFIVKDSIQIMYNGNSRYVQLEAFGQNANFYRDRIITGNATWTNEKPYVILGSLTVDTTASLTIQKGCKIYCHADAPFIIDGTLTINGIKSEPVIFAGDRLDEDYKDLPASWPGVYFRGTSKNNVISFAQFKNAYQAIAVEKPSINANPKVTLHQCIIDNAWDAGIICVNSSLAADNTLISNCGNNVTLAYGGTYSLIHCTLATYSTYFLQHKNPVLSVNNFAELSTGIDTKALAANFINCIFWGDNGNVDDEVRVQQQAGPLAFNVQFKNCLYKVKNDPAPATLTDNIKNQSPLFDSIDISKRYFDFHTSNPDASGINKGATGTGLLIDLDSLPRNVGVPDIGCYEKQ